VSDHDPTPEDIDQAKKRGEMLERVLNCDHEWDETDGPPYREFCIKCRVEVIDRECPSDPAGRVTLKDFERPENPESVLPPFKPLDVPPADWGNVKKTFDCEHEYIIQSNEFGLYDVCPKCGLVPNPIPLPSYPGKDKAALHERNKREPCEHGQNTLHLDGIWQCRECGHWWVSDHPPIGEVMTQFIDERAEQEAAFKEDLRIYLDNAITEWRRIRDTPDHKSAEMATYYIDAFQSVRVSMVGGRLPVDV